MVIHVAVCCGYRGYTECTSFHHDLCSLIVKNLFGLNDAD